ncbi:hypothetical protein K456DRAFT_938299 [Colletotrichum gloeosporioides 23]|nr:hypothetical protein K456DRAFT_938299 [Colletotrichum gloeosporioides 23]
MDDPNVPSSRPLHEPDGDEGLREVGRKKQTNNDTRRRKKGQACFTNAHRLCLFLFSPRYNTPPSPKWLASGSVCGVCLGKRGVRNSKARDHGCFSSPFLNSVVFLVPLPILVLFCVYPSLLIPFSVD